MTRCGAIPPLRQLRLIHACLPLREGPGKRKRQVDLTAGKSMRTAFAQSCTRLRTTARCLLRQSFWRGDGISVLKAARRARFGSLNSRRRRPRRVASFCCRMRPYGTKAPFRKAVFASPRPQAPRSGFRRRADWRPFLTASAARPRRRVLQRKGNRGERRAHPRQCRDTAAFMAATVLDTIASTPNIPNFSVDLDGSP